MKKVLFILLCTACLLSACQPTPDKPIVISKGDGTLQDTINGSPAPLEKYEAPAEWKQEIDTSQSSDKLLKVTVDAKINVPNVDAYPVYRVAPSFISVDDATDFIKKCLGSDELYDVETWRTQDVIMEEIKQKQSMVDQNLSTPANERDETTELELASYKNEVLRLQNEYKDAPPRLVSSRKNIKFIRDESVVSLGVSLYAISGVNKTLDSGIYISQDSNTSHGQAMHQCKLYIPNFDGKHQRLSEPWCGGERVKSTGLNGIKVDYNTAKEMADEFIYKTLGHSDYTLSTVGALYSWPEDRLSALNMSIWDTYEYYRFIYTQSIDDIPLLYYRVDPYIDNQNEVAPFWKQPFAFVDIDDSGILSVAEMSTLTVTEKLSSNVPLLPFERIQEIFCKYMPLCGTYTGTDYACNNKDPLEIRVEIDNIRLGYVKIREKGLPTEGIIVPAWIFYGNEHFKYTSQADTSSQLTPDNELPITNLGNPYLCINAIDGSIIDLAHGY